MGGTEPSLLNDTGYPLQAVEGVLDGKMIGSSLRDTIDTAGMHDVPTSGQSNSNGSEVSAPSHAQQNKKMRSCCDLSFLEYDIYNKLKKHV